jgi:RHS repeat-associated protein
VVQDDPQGNPPSVDDMFSADPYANRFLYTGREFLKEANLYDYRNRVYSAELGRFLQTDPIRFEAGDGNLYRYVFNNPINFIDPLGLEILLETHPVALGNNHSKITIIPENQPAYANDPRFSNTLPDEYATLGAGPEGGKLVSNPNRPRDINRDHNNFSKPLNPSDCGDGSRNEDQIIEDLFKSDSAYDDKFDYELFPNRFSNGYNSNGYVSGLLNSVGFSPSSPPGTPGFTKPVPGKSFGKP